MTKCNKCGLRWIDGCFGGEPTKKCLACGSEDIR